MGWCGVWVGVEARVDGVDRVDNTKGYTKENCVPCCKICNRLKSDLTKEEFEEYQKRVKEFNKNKK